MATSYAATLRDYTIGDFQDWEFTANWQLGIGDYEGQRAKLPGRHGNVPMGADLAGAGLLTFDLEYLHAGSTGAQAEAAGFALKDAWSPETGDDVVELEVVMQSGTFVYLGRPMRPDVITDEFGYGTAHVQFETCDPLTYLSTTKSVTATAGGTSGGLTTPLTTPVTTTGSGSTGDVSVTNAGTAPVSRWVIALTGGSAGVATPRLMLGGQVVTIDGTIPAGVTALVDSDTGTITIGGAAVPWISPTSVWWSIPPSTTSTFSYRAASGDGTATLIWRDANY